MTGKLRAAMQQALEALETLDCGDSYKTHNAATALREALAEQAEQEPVAYLCNGTRYKVQKLVGDVMICGLPDELIGEWVALVDATDGKHLRAAPARTKDLTEYELDELRFQNLNYLDYARAVIAADREKNK